MSRDEMGDGSDIRWLVASDPKQARIRFKALLTTGGEALHEFLVAAARPGDGRLRQMIAMVYRTDPTASSLETWLTGWLGTESDEFTRSALEAALTSRGHTPVRRRLGRSTGEQMVEAYRFVADRLCHRIRNGMALPNAKLRRLEQAVGQIADDEQRAELTQLVSVIQGGFVRVARNVEFNTDDPYLEWDSIVLMDWLSTQERVFAEQIGSGRLLISGHPSIKRVRVRAMPFLLDTLFGNLWSNAIQIEGSSQLELECAVDATQGKLFVVALDNGPGFSETHVDDAFQQMFSTKGNSRGRGLLEIADAVARLQGTVRLARRIGGDYRVNLELPIDSL